MHLQGHQVLALVENPMHRRQEDARGPELFDVHRQRSARHVLGYR